jgi:hypothetical protein
MREFGAGDRLIEDAAGDEDYCATDGMVRDRASATERTRTWERHVQACSAAAGESIQGAALGIQGTIEPTRPREGGRCTAALNALGLALIFQPRST